jgi:Tol biopolymer transport system component
MKQLRKWLMLCAVALPLALSACTTPPDANNLRIELPQQYRMPQANMVSLFERRSGRIAILDEKGNLVIMDQTAAGAVHITKDASGNNSQALVSTANPFVLTYHLPVWSPDASQIAFIELNTVRSSTSRVVELGAQAVYVQHGPDSIIIQQSQGGVTAQRPVNPQSVVNQPSRLVIERTSGGNVVSSALYVARSDGKSPLQELYASDKASLGYLDWSPDSSQIAFLAQTGQNEATLNLVSTDANASKARPVASGLFASWQWRPDSKTLLTKVDGSNTDNTADLSVVDAQAGKTIASIAQNADLPFGAPAYSSDGNAMLLTVKSDGKDYLALADAQGKVLRQLSAIKGDVRFSWSPVSAQVAYIVIDTSMARNPLDPTPASGALHLLDVNSGEDKVLSRMPVAGFFWSPDGQHIAAFSPARASDITKDFPGKDLTSDNPGSVLMLQTIEVNTRAFRQLFYLEPTEDFARVLRQFDRFSRSINIWAPDSKHLVFAVIYTNTQGPVNLIVETEASGSIEPRAISQGTLAVWSPR